MVWKDPDYHRKWRQANRDKWAAYNKKSYDKVRHEVLDHYGGECACCGESEDAFLCMDHVDGGGNEHRRTTPGTIYRILKREGFPVGFQVLCWNCNSARHIRGVCPHQVALTVNSGG